MRTWIAAIGFLAGQAAAQAPDSVTAESHHLARVIGATNMARIKCSDRDAAGLNAMMDALWAEARVLPPASQAFITGWSLASMEEGMRQTLGAPFRPEECEQAMAALARAQARRQAGR